MTNTLTEIGLKDAGVKNQVRKTLEYMESAFFSAIKHAQELGEVNSSRDAKLLAALLVNNLQGIFVLSKVGVSPAKMRSFTRQLLVMLD